MLTTNGLRLGVRAVTGRRPVSHVNAGCESRIVSIALISPPDAKPFVTGSVFTLHFFEIVPIFVSTTLRYGILVQEIIAIL